MVVLPPYSVGTRRDDYRTCVEIRPPKLPWSIAYYFARVVNDQGEATWVPEGSKYGAQVPDVDAAAAMDAAEHYREHARDYELMAMYLCVATPANERRAAEVYAARILGWRRLRRDGALRLRIRDQYRAYVSDHGRRHGATQAVADAIPMNRKGVRRALEECVQKGEMDAAEISWRSKIPPAADSAA
jgi:hypothetical protein